jgi:hypothetical protein
MLKLAESSINRFFHYMSWCDGPEGFSCEGRFVLINDTIHLLPPKGHRCYSFGYLDAEGILENFLPDEETFVPFYYANLFNNYLVESKNSAIFGLVNDRSKEFYAKIEEISQSFIADGIQIQKGMLNMVVTFDLPGDGFRDITVEVTPFLEDDGDNTLATLQVFDPTSSIGIEIIQAVKENFPVR